MFKKTITSIFMLPFFNIEKKVLQSNNYINTFSYNEDYPELKDHIFILFAPKNNELFREFLEDLYSKGNIVEDYAMGHYHVTVHLLPEEFESDFNLIRQGKYSKTSKDFHSKFKKDVKMTTAGGKTITEVSLQHQIFSKSQKLRSFWEENLHISLSEDQEVWEEFNLKRETLTMDYLANLNK